MRRAILLALLAVALPTVALADSIDFAFGGKLGTTASTSGTATATNTFSVTSSLLDLNFTRIQFDVAVSRRDGWCPVPSHFQRTASAAYGDRTGLEFRDLPVNRSRRRHESLLQVEVERNRIDGAVKRFVNGQRFQL